MKKLIAGLVLTILMTAAAQAGMGPIIADVAVTDLGGGLTQVSGQMISVRFTKDDVQTIGCSVRADIGGVARVSCAATDIDGNRHVCFSIDPSMIDAAKSISPYSFIRFIYDQTAECTSLLVAVRSHHIPDIRTENSVSK
jgi:hypothetical protein